LSPFTKGQLKGLAYIGMGIGTILSSIVAIAVIALIVFIYFAMKCPDGSRYDIFGAGCYQCPEGYSFNGLSLGDEGCKQHLYGQVQFVGNRYDKVHVVGDRMAQAEVQPIGPTCKQEFGDKAFFDIRGECWKCPDGYERTGFTSVTKDDACFQNYFNHDDILKIWPKTRYSKAIPLDNGRLCCDGIKRCPEGKDRDFFNGKCYKCPEGYERTILYPVTSDKACIAPCENLWHKSFDHWGGETCYACPKEYNRNGNDLEGDQACDALCEVLYPGSFLNFGDQKCYECPSGLKRNDKPINAGDACDSIVFTAPSKIL
jgi:hypothetical protein